MKNKLFLKASALVCSLALVVTGLQTAFAADRDYTLKKTYTVENASSVKAVELYKVRSDTTAGTMEIKEQDGDHLTLSSTNNNNSTLGIITEVDGIDFTDSSLNVDEWSYNMTFAAPEQGKYANFGFLNEWFNVGSTVAKQADGTYAVTNGNTEFYCIASDIQLNDDGYYFYQIKGHTLGAQIAGNPITVDGDNVTVGTNRHSSYPYDGNKGVFWKGTPTLNVSYVNNGDGTYTYTVKAVGVYTKNDSDYLSAADVVIKKFTTNDTTVFNTGYVLFGAANYSDNRTDITISNISVKYNKTVDYKTDCEQFLAANPIVETLYDGTFAPTADNAEDLKAQLNTALSKYNALADEVKTVFDNNFVNFADKVAAAVLECNRAVCGKFTVQSEETVIPSDITSLETEDYIQFFRNEKATTTAMFGTSNNTVKYTNSQNVALGIGAITKINGVDITGNNVDVKEWSYTVTADNSADSKIGYVKSWNYIRKDAVYAIGMTSNTKLGSDGYASLDIGIAGIKSADIGGKATYNSESGSWDYAKEGLSGYPYDSNFNFYWLGAPKFKVAYTDNNDGTHTYTVYATDIYTLENEVYTKTDDVLKVSKTVSDDSEAALDFVMIAGGSYKGNNKDMTISDINVKYSIEKDITADCISVLESGNGMIERLDGIVTAANAAQVSADVAALKAAYTAASADVKSAIDAKYAGLADKIAYAEKYADVAATKASPELLGINIKKVTTASASDLRFAVSYVADSNTDYTIKGYGAIVVPNQVKADINAELTKNTAVLAGKEGYFVDVYENATSVAVDANNQFYVNINNSKGKPGTLFDCRPYVVYTDGTDEFIVYASNSIADKSIANGQASKCIIFAARDMSNAILAKDGYTAKYPDGCNKDAYNAIINKIGRETTTSQEKNLVFQFLYENYTALV